MANTAADLLVRIDATTELLRRELKRAELAVAQTEKAVSASMMGVRAAMEAAATGSSHSLAQLASANENAAQSANRLHHAIRQISPGDADKALKTVSEALRQIETPAEQYVRKVGEVETALEMLQARAQQLRSQGNGSDASAIEAMIGSPDKIREGLRKLDPALQEAQKLAEQRYKQFSEQSTKTLSEVFYKGFTGDFDGIGKYLEETLLRSLANFAAEAATTQIVMPVVTKMMPGYFGGQSGASGGTAGMALPGGDLFGGLPAWLLGAPASGNANNPASYVPATSGLVGSGGKLLGSTYAHNAFLPAVASAMPGLMSGNHLQAGLGASGAILGTFASGGNPIGGMVGGSIGNLAGGMLGNKRRGEPAAVAKFGSRDGRLVVDRVDTDNDGSPDAARQAGEQIVQAINRVIEAGGLKLGDVGGLGVGVGGKLGNEFPADQAIEKVLKGLTSDDKYVQAALSKGLADGLGKNLDEMFDRLSFAKNIKQTIADLNNSAELLSARGKARAAGRAEVAGLTENLTGFVRRTGDVFGRIPGFARGTPSAPPGVALVGEEGPELVMMRGGEQVFDARRTAALLGGMGRNGDTLVAHINAREAALLRRLGGAGTINPRTGLLEFYDPDLSPDKAKDAGRDLNNQGMGEHRGDLTARDMEAFGRALRDKDRINANPWDPRQADIAWGWGKAPGVDTFFDPNPFNAHTALGFLGRAAIGGISGTVSGAIAAAMGIDTAIGRTGHADGGMIYASLKDALGSSSTLGEVADKLAASGGERNESGAGWIAREGGPLDNAVQGITEAYREQAQAAQAAAGATKDAAKTTTDAAKTTTEKTEEQKRAEEILAAARKSAGDNLDAVLKTDPLTEWEAAAEHLAGKMEGFAELFHRLGMDAQKVRDTYAEASRQLAGKFDRSVREQILAIENPAQLAFEQWAEERDAALRSARETGGNIAEVERLYGLKRQEIVERSLATQRDALLSAYQRESAELEQTRDAFKRLAETLKDTRQGLLLDPSLSPLDPGGRLEEARKQFEDIYKKAQLGDVEAGNRLPEAARTFLEASRGYNASSEAYAADFARVQSALANTETVAERHLRIAEQKLDSMRQQLSALGLLNTTVQTFGEALKQYLAAQSAAGGVNVPGGGGSGGGSSGGSSGGGHPPGTANNLAIVDDLYRNGLGWTPSGSELAYWTNHLNTGMSLDEVKRWMASSAREKGRTVGGPLTGFATGGSFTVEGASGIDALSLPQLRVTRGEIVNISRKDSMEGLATELRALRDEMRGLVRVTAASGDANVQGQKAMHEQLSDINRKARLEAAA